MAYDGFYPDLSTRGTTNDILDQALAVQATVVPLAAQVQTQSDAVAAAAGVIVPLVPTFQQAVVDAQTAAGASQSSANASASSATAAASSVAASGTNASNAANSATLSQQWAINPEDVVVADGKYSSYHWAQKAQAVVIGGGGAVFMQKANNLSDVGNVSIARSNLGLGTAALADSTSFQGANANLSSLSAQSLVADRVLYSTGANTLALSVFTAFGRSLLDDADAATARATLGLGTAATTSSTAYQPAATKLTNFNGTTNTADSLTYNTAATTFGVTPLTSFARSLLDDADAATARATLGVTSANTAQLPIAWVQFVPASTLVIQASFNITGVSRTGVGTFVVTLGTTQSSNTTWGGVGTYQGGTSETRLIMTGARTTTTQTVLTMSSFTTTADSTGTASVLIVFYGS